MRHFLSIIHVLCMVTAASGQANTKLSNLVPPTAINADLLPGTTNSRELGSSGLSWRNLYLAGDIFLDGNRFLHNRGSNNTFIGNGSGFSLTTGTSNTGTGTGALYYTTIGNYNTANGTRALNANSSGSYNSAFGYQSLQSNATGNYNTSMGVYALNNNTGGSYNVAIGYTALMSNTSGMHNVAIGYAALNKNTNSRYNFAAGTEALNNNTTGYGNIAIGNRALFSNTVSNYNTAIGNYAGANTSNYAAATFLGHNTQAGPNLTNITAVGSGAFVTTSNQVRIGNQFVTSIGGQVSWSNLSDGRYKKNIRQNVHGLDFINSLRPVSYNVDVQGLNTYYNKSRNQGENEGDETSTLNESAAKASMIIYNGFIAQEVEEAAKKLNYDFSGIDKPESSDGLYGLRYSDFVVPLVKAVQELSIENKELKEENSQLKLEFAELRQMVLELKRGVNNGGANLSSAYLEQNAPNPTSDATQIRYNLLQNSNSANIVFTDIKGAIIKSITLSNKRGAGQLTINTATWTAGTYTYTLYINGIQTDSKKLVISR
jgi:trimeric autotransporter adhesin